VPNALRKDVATLRRIQAENPALIKAFAHPLRARIIDRVVRVGPASPSAMAREFGARLTDVAYHTNTLAKLGLIEIINVRPTHASVEHVYGPVKRAP